MVPPSTSSAFVVAGLSLVGSTFWVLVTRSNRVSERVQRVQRVITLCALVGVVAVLFFTLLNYGYIAALLGHTWFSIPTPMWRALPAIAVELVSLSLLVVVLVRQRGDSEMP